MIGKVGRVTGKIGAGLVGEVVVSVRGGSEAFYAYSQDKSESFDVGDQVLIVDYQPPRTVYVRSWNPSLSDVN